MFFFFLFDTYIFYSTAVILFEFLTSLVAAIGLGLNRVKKVSGKDNILLLSDKHLLLPNPIPESMAAIIYLTLGKVSEQSIGVFSRSSGHHIWFKFFLQSKQLFFMRFIFFGRICYFLQSGSTRSYNRIWKHSDDQPQTAISTILCLNCEASQYKALLPSIFQFKLIHYWIRK